MISLRVQQLGKVYRLYARPVDSLKEWLLRQSYHEEFWALRDVTFSLPRGSSLGVVGENGAGKSTLLKVLAGTISPSCGTIERQGRTAGILELGLGFHPDLSGRENAYLGCALLGLTPAETEECYPEIVEFSELGDFMERPVKTYSSGMRVRLGFSVATCVDPDILVVDEALSVGDEHFQKKSLDRMLSFRDKGKTLVFCSHDLYQIKQVCGECIWLRNGRPEMLGRAADVADSYQDYQRSLDADVSSNNNNSNREPNQQNKLKLAFLSDVSVGGNIHDGIIETGGMLSVRVVARLTEESEADVHVGILIVRNDRAWCYGVSTEMDRAEPFVLSKRDRGVKFVINNLPLLAGEYSLTVSLLDGKGVQIYDIWEGLSPFTVRHNTNEVGLLRISHCWEHP